MHIIHSKKHRAVQFFSSLFDAIVTKKCPLCFKQYSFGYCDDCRKLLPWARQSCTVCAAQIALLGVCGECQKSPPPFFQSLIPFHYASPISDHILQLKYAQQLHHAQSLGIALANRVKHDPIPDVIIPLPLHNKRLAERGFNQSTEIAKVIGSLLNISVDYRSLMRIKNTRSQKGLTEKQRRQNLKNAFTCHQKPAYKHVALVDDVVTSGSTTKSAAHVLHDYGTKKISVWALAKTTFEHN